MDSLISIIKTGFYNLSFSTRSPWNAWCACFFVNEKVGTQRINNPSQSIYHAPKEKKLFQKKYSK